MRERERERERQRGREREGKKSKSGKTSRKTDGKKGKLEIASERKR